MEPMTQEEIQNTDTRGLIEILDGLVQHVPNETEKVYGHAILTALRERLGVHAINSKGTSPVNSKVVPDPSSPSEVAPAHSPSASPSPSAAPAHSPSASPSVAPAHSVSASPSPSAAPLPSAPPDE